MFAQATSLQYWSGNSHVSQSSDHQENRRAAIASFDRARRHGMWRRLLSKITHRPAQLQHYSATGRQHFNHAGRSLQTVALDQVVGSEGRSRDFDDQFWPLTEHSRDRWVSIAVAMGIGKPLPPVQLVKAANGYVVRDGHHRLSVARAIGQVAIEAEIV